MNIQTLFFQLNEVFKKIEEQLMQEVDDENYYQELVSFLLQDHIYDSLFKKHHLNGNPRVYKFLLLQQIISDFYIMVYHKQARKIPVSMKEFHLFGELVQTDYKKLPLWICQHRFDDALEFIVTNYLERRDGCLFENALVEDYLPLARKREMDYLMNLKSEKLFHLCPYYPLFYEDVSSLSLDFGEQVLTDFTCLHVEFLHLLVEELEKNEELCEMINSAEEEEEYEEFDEDFQVEQEEQFDSLDSKLMELCVELEDLDEEEIFLETHPIGKHQYHLLLNQVKDNLIRVRDSYLKQHFSKQELIDSISYILANVYTGLCSDPAPLSSDQKHTILYIEQLSISKEKAVQEFIKNDLFAFYILRYFFYYNIKNDKEMRIQRENRLDLSSKKVLMKLYEEKNK